MPEPTAEVPLVALARWDTRPALRTLTPGGWRCWDYAALAASAAAQAAWLARHGVCAGQVVLCPTRPAADLVVMDHALAAIGAALLPVAPGLDPQARARLIAQTGCECVWVPAPASPRPTARRHPGRLRRTGQAPADPPPLAALVQTSGSSGTPKVAMLTRAALRASAERINARLGLGAGDRWLCCLPRQHIGGLAIGWRCALAGAEIAIHDGFDTAAVARALHADAITHISLVPPMLARLLDLPGAPPPALRVALLGGQALDPALARRATAQGWPLYVGYGMTETGSQIAGAWVGGAGTWPALAPLPGVVLADTGRCPAAGAALRVQGPMCMAGYANPARRPGDGLAAGWLQTADLGCRTASGLLQILGRADEVLVIGGVNVLPGAVAARLTTAPGIGEVAVVGLPEPVWGYRLIALYTGPAAGAALAAWGAAHLPGAERPRAWHRLEALPRLASGKPDRLALRALAARLERGAGAPPARLD